MEYTFTLTYQLRSTENDFSQLVERLGKGGCDDALIGIGQPGRLALEFSREAINVEVAICSALRNVRDTIPSARLIEVSPDLVGLSDVAQIVGVTRQNLRKLMLSHGDRFPLPAHAGSVALWHLADLLPWLRDQVGYIIADHEIDVARFAQKVNAAKASRIVSQSVRRRIVTSLATHTE